MPSPRRKADRSFERSPAVATASLSQFPTPSVDAGGAPAGIGFGHRQKATYSTPARNVAVATIGLRHLGGSWVNKAIAPNPTPRVIAIMRNNIGELFG